jgi:ABC-type multidrug transport system fused ATPase/permease subunit
MHNKMAESVLRAPIEFFDSNPIGRILTRFSKDVTVLDTCVSFFTPFIAYGLFRAVGVAIVLCVVNPWVLIPLAFALIYMMYTLKRNIFGLIES